ncbi:MAG: hypothetical protein JWP91_3406 [Fibrobacteres bacterium]|nr:hypothetical protein [Fibrobacterota bacterium]
MEFLKTLRMPALALALVSTGCSERYTRHMSEDYKDKKLDGVTFGILSMPEMEYSPPSSCMSNGHPEDGPKYRKEWEGRIIKSLTGAFKKQKFVSIPSERLEELGISAPSFYSLAASDIGKMGLSQYNDNGGNIKPIDYQPSRGGGQMKAWAEKLKQNDSVDYIIALVDPKMIGKIITTYTTNGSSSSTVYTADVRYGVWSAETGELAYASGTISNSGGFCLSPQSSAISGSGSDMSTQLKDLITAFLNRLDPERLQLGQATLPPAP